jgi:hypothetical protein
MHIDYFLNDLDKNQAFFSNQLWWNGLKCTRELINLFSDTIFFDFSFHQFFFPLTKNVITFKV